MSYVMEILHVYSSANGAGLGSYGTLNYPTLLYMPQPGHMQRGPVGHSYVPKVI